MTTTEWYREEAARWGEKITREVRLLDASMHRVDEGATQGFMLSWNDWTQARIVREARLAAHFARLVEVP